MSEEIEDWLTAIEKAVEKGFDPSLNETQISDLQKQIDDIRNILKDLQDHIENLQHTLRSFGWA